MDYRVQFKEPQFRFYKIKRKELWLDKKRKLLHPWVSNNIGREGLDWKLEVSLMGTIHMYFLNESKMVLFILRYGELVE